MSEFAGRLRERIVLMRRGGERDALGGAQGAWSALGTAWAAIAPEAPGARSEADAVSAMPRWRVTLRAPCEATIEDRLMWRERTLRVRSLTADPRWPDRIMITAEEER